MQNAIKSLTEEILDRLPFQATAHIEAEDWNFTLSFRGEDEKLVGYFRISTENPSGFMWRATPAYCRTAWREVGSPEPLWVVRAAEWFQSSARGLGLAKLAYEVMFLHAGDGVVVGGKCTGEGTSLEAERVWTSFKRRYVHHGPMLKLPLEFL
jgi:hypothetical protein